MTRIIDEALGAPILREITAQHAEAGAPVRLPALFEKLGVIVNQDGSVRLEEHAALAAVRRRIVFGDE